MVAHILPVPLRALIVTDEAASCGTTHGADVSLVCDVVSTAAGSDLCTSDGSRVWDVLSGCDFVWLASAATAGTASCELVAIAAAAAASEVPIYAPALPRFRLPGIEVTVADCLATVPAILDGGAKPPTPSRGLTRLQRYYVRMAELRRYNTPEPLEAMLLLTEEVGELAHAIRKHTGMVRTHPYRSNLAVAEELADVQLFLLHLANVLEESLSSAVREKEATNHTRAASRLARPLTDQTLSYLSIEGLIGSGKTTTAQLVSSTLHATPVLERVESHPFLRDFYEDGLDHVLELELGFILMRWHQIRQLPRHETIVSDYSPYKDIVFSQVLITSPTDLDLVNRTYEELWQRARSPELTMFLDLPPRDALDRIKLRGRDFEQRIDIGYLERLGEKYRDCMAHLGRDVVVLQVVADESPQHVADRVVAEAEARGFPALAEGGRNGRN